MKADMYKTARKRMFLFLPHGNAFSSVPQPILDKLGSVQFWKTVELAPNIIAVDPDAVTAGFEKQGYFVGAAKVQISEPKQSHLPS
jgi:uncharacterized protein YcgL (UPF0745 family)